MIKVRRISIDIILNFLASFVPLFILQFLIQPYVARKIGADKYGSLLLILGIINIGIGVFGNTLNNARLLDNHFYQKEKGDYPILLIIFCLFNSLFTFFALRIYQIHFDYFSYSVIIFTGILAVSNSYFFADYRIHLNYKKILACKLSLTIGYGVGLLLFQHTKRWEWIFFIGYLLEFGFVILTTQISREPCHLTPNIKKTLQRLFFLVLSSVLGSGLVYLDRLIIFPVFGGAELSFYYAASIVGKTLSLVTGPMTGVLLSYIVKIDRITKKQFSVYSITLLGFGILGFYICLIISKPLIGLLYPDLLTASLRYIPYTVAASMFGIFYSFVWPIVLRFGKNSYPLIITVLKAIVYLGTAVFFVRTHGVLGIALANLLASATQAMTVFFLGFNISNKKSMS